MRATAATAFGKPAPVPSVASPSFDRSAGRTEARMGFGRKRRKGKERTCRFCRSRRPVLDVYDSLSAAPGERPASGRGGVTPPLRVTTPNQPADAGRSPDHAEKGERP